MHFAMISPIKEIMTYHWKGVFEEVANSSCWTNATYSARVPMIT
jgi:hypothetical protein